MKIENLRGKKIALVGFGIENVSLAKFLIKKNIDFTILDKAEIAEMSEETQELIKSKKLEVKSGEKYLSHLINFDVIVRSPGVKYLTPEIQAAKKAGVVISSSTILFFENCPAKIIGVTGTKGKGTTASLIFQIIERNFQFSISDFQSNQKPQDKKSKVYLVGNIGIPSFDIVEKIKKDDIVIFELSSFQLQDMQISPWIAVVTNLADDHLDYHKTLSEYRSTKQNILKYQRKSDYAVLNFDYPESRKMENIGLGEKFFFSAKKKIEKGAFVSDDGQVILTIGSSSPVVSASEIKLIGRHNLENIAAASVVGKILNIKTDQIGYAVKKFSGLPHRLEFIRDVDKVKFYNDSFSTNPTPTIAAIKSFNSPITLILGGSEKGADFSELAEVIKSHPIKNVITIGVEGSRIRKTLENSGAKVNILNGGKNINEIVDKSYKVSSAGDVVLFSPACASFDMFKNYKDRGEKFKQAVKAL